MGPDLLAGGLRDKVGVESQLVCGCDEVIQGALLGVAEVKERAIIVLARMAKVAFGTLVPEGLTEREVLSVEVGG